LPKGTDVVVLSRPVSWQSSDVPRGPNDSPPSDFDPARYLVAAADGSLTSVFPNTKLGGFLGFGHGARACPGRTYSEALSYAVLVAVLQAFTWCLTPDHPKPRFIFDIIMSPDCDINLALTKRDVVIV
jgi:cytochrome P450